MSIEIPAIPLGVLTLLSFFAPYAIALINHPGWKSGSKRLVSIFVSIVLAVVVLALYYLLTGDTLLGWPWMILLTIVVVQAAFALLRKSVTQVEGKYGIKSPAPVKTHTLSLDEVPQHAHPGTDEYLENVRVGLTKSPAHDRETPLHKAD